MPPEWSPGQDMEKVLDDTVRAVFGDQPPVGVQRQVHEGGAAKVLLDASEGAIMLVVGSRGHGGFAGLLLGSVSANVAEQPPAPCWSFTATRHRPRQGPHDRKLASCVLRTLTGIPLVR